MDINFIYSLDRRGQIFSYIFFAYGSNIIPVNKILSCCQNLCLLCDVIKGYKSHRCSLNAFNGKNKLQVASLCKEKNTENSFENIKLQEQFASLLQKKGRKIFCQLFANIFVAKSFLCCYDITNRHYCENIITILWLPQNRKYGVSIELYVMVSIRVEVL